MISLELGLKKSPGLLVLTIVTIPLFVGGLFFAMMPVDSSAWQGDLSSALSTTRSGFTLYFGIVLPLVIAGASAVMMNPEFQRGNAQWLMSHPKGISFIMREKLIVLVLFCAVNTLTQGVVVVTFGGFRGAWATPEFTHILVGAVASGVGMLAVGSLYVFVSTFARTMAGTVSIAIGLTIMTMVLVVIEAYATGGTSYLETILPTSQIISTTGYRSADLKTGRSVLSLVIALTWMVSLWALAKKRLESRSSG